MIISIDYGIVFLFVEIIRKWAFVTIIIIESKHIMGIYNYEGQYVGGFFEADKRIIIIDK